MFGNKKETGIPDFKLTAPLPPKSTPIKKIEIYRKQGESDIDFVTRGIDNSKDT